MARNAYLGKDSVMYAENSEGYVYLTVPEAPLKEGFVRKIAETVPDVEAVWAKIDAQERQKYEQMNEKDFKTREHRMKIMRSDLNSRMAASDCSNSERDFIRECLKVLDRKETMLYRNSIYGVAAMQEKEAPLAPSPKKVD